MLNKKHMPGSIVVCLLVRMHCQLSIFTVSNKSLGRTADEKDAFKANIYSQEEY